MRTAKLWVGTVRDLQDRRESPCVYVFPEGHTEQQVLAELWKEWVTDLDEATPTPDPITWEALNESFDGDWEAEFDLQDVEVKE